MLPLPFQDTGKCAILDTKKVALFAFYLTQHELGAAMSLLSQDRVPPHHPRTGKDAELPPPGAAPWPEAGAGHPRGSCKGRNFLPGSGDGQESSLTQSEKKGLQHVRSPELTPRSISLIAEIK